MNTENLNSGTTRRRLLKGLATVAPVILTLRSGSTLAQSSSCEREGPGYIRDTTSEDFDENGFPKIASCGSVDTGPCIDTSQSAIYQASSWDSFTGADCW